MLTDKKILIVTCVSNFQLYAGLEESVHINESVQLYPIDNTHNNYSIPLAYNYALNHTNADIYVFVHQDVIFPKTWFECLDNQIKQIEIMDKKWGVLGIMGRKKNGQFAGHIIDPHTKHRIGRLPAPVVTLDEVCLIIRKSSGLSFDEELGGYHLYGADICLQSKQKKLNCYAIDACLKHLSGGKIDDSYLNMLKIFRQKWSKINHTPHFIETTCGIYQLKKGVLSSSHFYYIKLLRKLMRKLQMWFAVK